MSAEDTSHLFHENVVKLHGIPNKIISDRDPRFTSRFWSEVSQMMGTRQSMSTANHPQTDGQTERVNRVLEDMLQHYVGPTQEDWDEHLASAEFAYNNAWHESIKNTPFMLNYGQHPLTPMYRGISRDRVPAARAFVGAMFEMLAEAKEHLKAAQKRQKAHANKKRREVSYDIGDQLLLSTKNIKLKTLRARKLLPKWIGPFRVVKRIGEVAYKVELLDTMQMHDVFHVSLLKPYRSDGTIQPPPSPLFIDNELMFKVDRVLMHCERKSGKKVIREFLIKWLGCGPEHNSWEPEKNLSNDLLNEYWATVAVAEQRRALKGVESASLSPRTQSGKRKRHRSTRNQTRQIGERPSKRPSKTLEPLSRDTQNRGGGV